MSLAYSFLHNTFCGVTVSGQLKRLDHFMSPTLTAREVGIKVTATEVRTIGSA